MVFKDGRDTEKSTVESTDPLCKLPHAAPKVKRKLKRIRNIDPPVLDSGVSEAEKVPCE